MKSISRFPRLFIALLGLATIVLPTSMACGQGGNPGAGAPFKGIYGFGDSLLDTGNRFAATGQPAAPYFEGRTSNGILWIEYLAEAMGIGSDSIHNYAFAGATTGRENFYDVPGGVGYPGVQDQIDAFVNDLGRRRADSRGLYIVLAGSNDVFVTGPTPQTVASAVQNTAVAIQRLHQAGARRIMVFNLPDLGLTPFGRSVDPAGLSFFTLAYNQALDSALDQLRAAGIDTIRVNSAGIVQSMVANPSDYGFTNVTDPYLAIQAGDPAEFLFWDLVHPTTDGHRVIGEEAYRVLRQRFRHVWGTPAN